MVRLDLIPELLGWACRIVKRISRGGAGTQRRRAVPLYEGSKSSWAQRHCVSARVTALPATHSMSALGIQRMIVVARRTVSSVTSLAASTPSAKTFSSSMGESFEATMTTMSSRNQVTVAYLPTCSR